MLVQVQVMRIQEVSYEQRTAYLMELRRAYINGKLRLNPVEQAIASLVTAVRNESKKVFSTNCPPIIHAY